ncbi:hypothetical protein Tco_0489792 [Tanacetum coccineum]
MHREQAQQAARDEKLVPTEDKVKIGKTNLRVDPTLTQKEETYQVILDIIKNTPCYNAFLISADVPEIYMQRFWFTIKRVKKSSFYQSDLDNKTCQINVELFREILGINLRVPNQEFTVPPSNDSLFDFLLELGYKGKGAQGTKATVTPKKATAATKKKKAKKIESSDEELEEQEERIIRRKPRAQLEINTQKAIKARKCESRFQHQSGGSISDEGAGTSSEVPDETKDKNEAQDDQDDWGSTDDETFLFNDKDEKIKDIMWVSTDEDESDDEDEEDDESINIEKTDDERTELDNDDHEMLDAAKSDVAKEHKKNAKKVEEQKANEELKPDEEQQEDNQAGDEQVEFLNSPNVSLIEPFHAVKVSVIPEPTQIPPYTPPAPPLPATIIPSVPVPNHEAFNDVVQRVSELEKDVKELKQVDHSPAILESIKSEVPEAVNKYLGSTLRDTLQKEIIPKYSATPYDQAAEDGHKQKEILFQMMMASKLAVDPASQRKRWHDDKDQDPPAGLDQGMKKRRTGKSIEPSKKSSKSKESTKGKTSSNTSKPGKSVSADKSVHEPEHVVQMDDEEPNFDNVANDADEPQADVILKILKKDWFKNSPRPEILNPD